MRSVRYYLNSISQKVVVYLNRKKPHGGKIYMFHDVYNTCEQMREQEVSISTEHFKEMIEWLHSQNQIASLQEVLETKSERLCAITFDDIYDSAYDNAIPILREKQIPYTCFISIGIINQSGFIREDELNELITDPLCTICTHTINHVELRKCSDVEAYREISDCKAVLEKKMKREIKYFAFPYGSRMAVATKHEKMAKKSGYQKAFSTFAMPLIYSYCKKHPFFLPRISINDRTYRLEIRKG